MAWFSYHGGHSGQYCRHAKGSLREVVEAAVAGGFSSYGLSEHCSRLRSEELYPDEAGMTPEDLDQAFNAYAREARALQQEFAGRIELLVGFETEALPYAAPGQHSWRELMSELRQRHDFDYVVGSVHTVRGIPIDYTQERTTQAEQALGGYSQLCIEYYREVAELVTQLRPEITGHLDLIRRFKGHDVAIDSSVWPHVEAALLAVKDTGSLLEVNAAPVRRGFGPVYPSRPILERALELGIPVTLGDDSHGPTDVGGGLDACVKLIAEVGYSEVHTLERLPNGKAGCTTRSLPIEQLKPI